MAAALLLSIRLLRSIRIFHVVIAFCCLPCLYVLRRPSTSIQKMACTSVHWTNPEQCGPGGINCQPFSGHGLAFHCPADCRASEITTPRYVGSQMINHRPLVIGGPLNLSDHSSAVYRGDSFVCGAAIHAGVVSDRYGGCGILNRRTDVRSFPSVTQNGIESISFNASFPLALSFERHDGPFCRDYRWELLFNSVILTAVIVTWIKTPATAFALVFTIVFFHVALISDPPDEPEFSDSDRVFSKALERFLPAAFTVSLLYQYVISTTICPRSSREILVLWLSTTWIGALSNVILREVPLQRLTLRDLREQKGAKEALICIFVVILGAIVLQLLTIRASLLRQRLSEDEDESDYRNRARVLDSMTHRLLTPFSRSRSKRSPRLNYEPRSAGACKLDGKGKLRTLIIRYVYGLCFLLLLCLFPGQTLRIHHYILALILLPGTAFHTRTSMVYQGFLLGLFVNGVARWGFASILETEAAIFAGRHATAPLPDLSGPTFGNGTIQFQWQELPVGWSGMQVVANDVLQYQEIQSDGSPLEFVLQRRRDETIYIRACLLKTDKFRGLNIGECTSPGAWNSGDEWSYEPT